MFAAHALAISLFTFAQCLYYRATTKSRLHSAYAVFLALLVGFVILRALDGSEAFDPSPSSASLSSALLVAKMSITATKYLPQAIENCRRRSTDGWSIGNIILDLTGATFSFLQNFLYVAAGESWEAVWGNSPKVGLALVAFSFDLLFLLQHFVLYRKEL